MTADIKRLAEELIGTGESLSDLVNLDTITQAATC
jgi:hypothetical protein